MAPPVARTHASFGGKARVVIRHAEPRCRSSALFCLSRCDRTPAKDAPMERSPPATAEVPARPLRPSRTSPALHGGVAAVRVVLPSPDHDEPARRARVEAQELARDGGGPAIDLDPIDVSGSDVVDGEAPLLQVPVDADGREHRFQQRLEVRILKLQIGELTPTASGPALLKLDTRAPKM